MTNIANGDVPETDAQVDTILDAANPATADAPAPEADPAEEADHEAPRTRLNLDVNFGQPAARASRTGNSAWLDEETLTNFNALYAEFAKSGYTRPEIKAMAGLTASAVYRAENGKVHGGDELDTWMELFKAFAEGKLPPSGASLRPPKAADLQARIVELEATFKEALAVLSNEEAKSVKDLRAVVASARELLSA